MTRRIFLAVALLACWVCAPGARAQSVDDILKRGTLVVAIDLTNPPWGYLDANQEPAGFDPALAKLMADRLGVKLQIERVTSPTRIPFLLSGRADVVISTLSITTERAKQVWFSIPYARNPLILIAAKSKPYKAYADLKGARVAVPRGSPQDLTVTKEAPGATIMRFEDDASAQQALVTGQADVLGGGILVPAVLNRMHPGEEYEPKIELARLYMGMAIRRGQADLLRWVNSFIFSIKEGGELERLHKDLLNVPVGDLPVF